MSSDDTTVRRWLEGFPLGHLEVLGASLSDFSDCDLGVTLVTYGRYENDGWDYLVSVAEQEDVFNRRRGLNRRRIIESTHRLERIFNHSDHLSSRGKHCSAQAEFINIYGEVFGSEEFYQFFRSMVYKIYDSIQEGLFAASVLHLLSCNHGHHRSQAFGELLAKLLRYHWPFLRVDLWHLDDWKSPKPHRVLSAPDYTTHFKDPLLKALSPPFYFRPLHYRTPHRNERSATLSGTVEEERTVTNDTVEEEGSRFTQ